MLGYTEIFNWGADYFGQFGTRGKRYESPKVCTYNILIGKVSCGNEHAVLISKLGHVYTIGSNADGRLGIGDWHLRSSSTPCLVEKLLDRSVIDISSGFCHSAALTANGSVFTWGQGTYGSLGLGDTHSRDTPCMVNIAKVTTVCCGAKHTGAVVGNRKVAVMWGQGEAGQLGTGNRENETLPVELTIKNTKEVACGVLHSLFLTTDGRVLACGGNSRGQLGTGDTKSVCSPVKVAGLDLNVNKIACGSHSACISNTSELFVWGLGESLVPCKVDSVCAKSVSIGNGFGAVIDHRAVVWTWGKNDHGELGQSDFTHRVAPTPIALLKNKTVESISCGSNYAIAIGQDVYSRTKVSGCHTERSRSVRSPVKETAKTPRGGNISGVSSKDCTRELRRFIGRKGDSQLNMLLAHLLSKFDKYRFHYKRKQEASDSQGVLKQLVNTQDSEAKKNYTREKDQLTIEIAKLKSEDSLKAGTIDSLRTEVKSLQEALAETKKQSLQSFKQEIEARKELETHGNVMELERMIRGLTEQSERLLEENTRLKLSVNSQFPESPIEKFPRFSMDSQDLVEFNNRRRSEYPASSEIDPFQMSFVSTIKPMDCSVSPSFSIKDNAPPTFREHETSGSVIYTQGTFISSLTDIKARIGALQENKEELNKRIAQLELRNRD